jgi:hypothetical protein
MFTFPLSKSLDLHANRAISIVAFLYPLLVVLGISPYDGIMFADFLLPIIGIFVLFKSPFETLVPSIAILLYGLIVGLIGTVFGFKDLFLLTLFLLRSASFFLVFLFFRALKDADLSHAIHALKFGVVIAACASLLGFLFDIELHQTYSHIRLLGISSPAPVGFVLGLIGLYFIEVSLQRSKLSLLVLGMLAIALSLLGLTISATIAIIAGLVATVLSRLIFGLDFPFKKLFKIAIASSLVILFLFHDFIANFFWRLGHIPRKLKYRLEKVEESFSSGCDSLYCNFFGMGPGSDSFFKSLEYGKSSILSFDQLYGRLLFEWGVLGLVGWLAWFAFNLRPISRDARGLIIRPVSLALLAFGFVYGFGSEFIFLSYSGSIFAVLLGLSFHEKVYDHRWGNK